MRFEDELGRLIARLGARTAERAQRLYFPEHVVLPVLADRATIELMLFARLSIVELRRASDSPAFFLDDIDRDEQRAVCEVLSERTEWPGMDVPAVCSSRYRGESCPYLDRTDARRSGHGCGEGRMGGRRFRAVGTGRAWRGLALFGDLTPHLAGTEVTSLTHRLESVKILPPGGI